MLQLACYLDPGTHFYLSETQLSNAEKYLKEAYPYIGNKEDNFCKNSRNIDIDDVSANKKKSILSNLANDLGNCK